MVVGAVLPRKSGPPVSPNIRVRNTVMSGYLGCLHVRIQETISTIRRVVDQLYALKCMVAGSKPSMGPVRYREVRSIPLKYVRNFIFDPFLRFFSV